MADDFGRAGLPLDRYHKQKTGPKGQGSPSSDKCDLCGEKLVAGEQSMQVVHWRLPERQFEGSKEHMASITDNPGAVVNEKDVDYREMVGNYFLCRGCRTRLRPSIGQALFFGVIAAAIGYPLCLKLGGDLALWMKMIGVALFFQAGILLGLRSRYREFPADMGFSLFSTSFDSNQKMVAIIISGLVLVVLPVYGLIAGYKDPIQVRLADLDPGGHGSPDRIRLIGEAMNDLQKTVPEPRYQLDEWVYEGWKQELKTKDGYKTVMPYLVNLKVSLENKRFKSGSKSAIATMSKETPAQRLARLEENKTDPPFSSESDFESVLTTLAQQTGAKPMEVAAALDQAQVDLNSLSIQTSMLKLTKALSAAAAKPDHPDLASMVKQLKIDVGKDPSSYK